MTDRDLPQLVGIVRALQLAVQRQERAAVVAGIAQLAALRAPMGEQWQQLAALAREYGELGLARQAIDLFVEASGDRPTVRFQKMSFLATLGDWEEAYALVRTLPEHVPDTFGNAYSRGSTALYSGRPAEAQAHFQRVTRMRPQSGNAWFGLSIVTDFSREPELADGLVAAAAGMEAAGTMERVAYQHALGKAYADLGEHALAFAAFDLGARLMRSVTPYDGEADAAEAAAAVAGYTPERIAAIADKQSEPTGRTLFVTGPPRSGTTLVEQILASHSTVTGAGEISRLMLLAHELGGASWPALSAYVEANGAASAARLWHHWLDEICPGAQRVVDKSLSASRYLGLAAALLPEAPVIWMTRDPLDCAWSCFRTNFVGVAMPWSFDLAEIAAHLRLEEALRAQWQELLGERLLVVPYEELVMQPEAWIRRILAHAGLGEEPQVFAPHENARLVGTASMTQVRQPINRAGIGAAAPYREFLSPFIEAYRG